MNRNRTVGIVLAVMMVSLGAFAELQNVQVGGSLRIRGIFQGGLIPNNDNFVEQRTRLNVKADFTDNVSAFIEFDDYSLWGEGFRSNYLTGVDSRPNGVNTVSVYQAYIDVKEIGGSPLSLRAGRQEIMELVSPSGPVYQAGTFSGNPLSLSAGIATIDWLDAHPEQYSLMRLGD
jgi:hypothetical protein